MAWSLPRWRIKHRLEGRASGHSASHAVVEFEHLTHGPIFAEPFNLSSSQDREAFHDVLYLASIQTVRNKVSSV